jgi:hypothetical protein
MEDVETTEVRLPVDKDAFKDFVKAILGKPQTITRIVFGTFSLEISDLTDLFHLVDQRVHQQNKAQLIQFTTKMVYSDNSTRLLSSLEELETFSEPRDVYPIAVHLDIDYLVRFVDDKSPDGFGKPEKQEVVLSIATSGLHKYRMVNMDTIGIFPAVSEGYFEITIKHTAISWGADIESLLTKAINTHIKKESKVKQFIRNHSGGIGLFVGGVFFSVCVLLAILKANSIDKLQKDKIVYLLNSVDNETVTALHVKMNYIIEKTLNNGGINQSFITTLFLILSLIISIFLGVWVGSSAENNPASFLVFNKEAKKNKEVIEKKISRKWCTFCVSVLVSVLTGLLTNWIFLYLCNMKIIK